MENARGETSKADNLVRDRKGGLSCAECRRSKLRCDRTFPCQACIRRGCATICPDGTLAATKGNKILMNKNQTLNQQVKAMTTRIHDLEAAIGVLRSERSAQKHRHLKDKSAHVNSPQDSDSEASEREDMREAAEALGSLSLGYYGETRFHGETAGSEYLQTLLPIVGVPKSDDPLAPNLQVLGLPWQILELVNSFPFGTTVRGDFTKAQFVHFLPPHQKALELSTNYYENAAWMYDPVPKADFMTHTMKELYDTPSGEPYWDQIHCHELSVFFFIMAIGSFYEEENQFTAVSTNRYHALGSAALSLISMVTDATCATIQALFLVTYFMFLSDRLSAERRWLLTGLAARLAYRIGLQRDSAGFNLSAAETQRRRVMFWELFIWDMWTSVVFGRPPAMSSRTSDCRFPEDEDPILRSNGETELGFHAWKYRMSAVSLSQSVQHVFSTKAIEYSALLELDRKIRKFPVPSQLQAPTEGTGEPASGRSWSSYATRAMMQYCVLCCRESNLLYIHRSSFAQAIRTKASNPLSHKCGASVIAVYRSACLLVSGLRSLHGRHPKPTSRVWFFWSGVFSACIVLGALVIESPGCSLGANALAELDQAISLYAVGSQPCRPPPTLDVLMRLQQRAHRAYAYFYAGKSNAAASLETENDDQTDDLRVTLGSTTVLRKAGAQPIDASNASLPSAATTSTTVVEVGSRQGSAVSSAPNVSGDILMRPAVNDDFTTYFPDQYASAPMAASPHAAMAYEVGNLQAGEFVGGVQYQLPVKSYELSPQVQNTAIDYAEQTQEEVWQNFLNDLGIMRG